MLQHSSAGHGIVANAAQMIALHQILQVLFIHAHGKLEKQLTDLFFIGHACDGAFHPGDILIGEEIRHSFQIDQD